MSSRISGTGQGPTPDATPEMLLHCLEGLEMGIAVLDSARRVVHWNAWLSRHSGIPRRLAIGTPLRDLFPELREGRLLEAVEDAIGTGLPAVLSHQVGGGLLPLIRHEALGAEPMLQSITIRPVQIGGRPGCLVQVQDRTADVQRERKLRAQRNGRYHAIVEAAQDCIVTIDEGGSIQGMNPAAEARFGHASQDLLGQAIGLLLPDYATSEEARSAIRATWALDAGGAAFDVEITEGGWVANGLRYRTLSIRDVTARNQAAEELRRSQRMQALGELTGGIAHEFNNLLMVMRANAELLADGSHPEARHLAAEVLRAADRGRALTDGLLSFARKQPLRAEQVSARHAVEETIGLAAASLGAGIEVRTAFPEEALEVLVDRVQLQNALLNLLINARDAMPRGGTITVSVARTGPGSGTIAVHDSGVGMAADTLARACEPFFTTKGPGRGTGLGLSMVNGFARQSGGSFALLSRPGEGTRACLELPLPVGDPPPSGGCAPGPVPEGGSMPALRTVLVVEDDPQVQTVLRGMLRDVCEAVVVVDDAPSALEFLVANEVDLLLTDLALPRGMSGHVLAREVRRLDPRVAVILMSAYNEFAGEHAGLPADADILRKPFDRAALEHQVIAACRRVDAGR